MKLLLLPNNMIDFFSTKDSKSFSSSFSSAANLKSLKHMIDIFCQAPFHKNSKNDRIFSRCPFKNTRIHDRFSFDSPPTQKYQNVRLTQISSVTNPKYHINSETDTHSYPAQITFPTTILPFLNTQIHERISFVCIRLKLGYKRQFFILIIVSNYKSGKLVLKTKKLWNNCPKILIRNFDIETIADESYHQSFVLFYSTFVNISFSTFLNYYLISLFSRLFT